MLGTTVGAQQEESSDAAGSTQVQLQQWYFYPALGAFSAIDSAWNLHGRGVGVGGGEYTHLLLALVT